LRISYCGNPIYCDIFHSLPAANRPLSVHLTHSIPQVAKLFDEKERRLYRWCAPIPNLESFTGPGPQKYELTERDLKVLILMRELHAEGLSVQKVKSLIVRLGEAIDKVEELKQRIGEEGFRVAPPRREAEEKGKDTVNA